MAESMRIPLLWILGAVAPLLTGATIVGYQQRRIDDMEGRLIKLEQIIVKVTDSEVNTLRALDGLLYEIRTIKEVVKKP